MDKARGAIKKAAGKLPGIETEEAQERPSAREESSATGHQEYFRELIEQTNRRSESGGLGGSRAKEDTGSGTAGSREPLEEATKEYVERLKEAYPGINERDLYELVYPIALCRVEDAEGA